ncbi:MAG: hypothetical protein LBT54_03045 [Bifidobacteriaceae bacterium]|nr:hypothetical protein [Bifidobacteriaceae bacterium]
MAKDITGSTIHLARRISPPALHSLDAIHLATATELGVGGLVTYDTRLYDAAASVGLRAVTPRGQPR